MPLLGDTNAWLQDVFEKRIDEAGILFFSQLGYADPHLMPTLPRCHARRFVYSILPEDRLLNALDRIYMKAINEASILFTIEDGTDQLPFFAVDMKSVGSARSDEAYGIHYILAKCCEHNNIVLFRHEDSLLLSFQMVHGESGICMFLSDWISCHTRDEGQLEEWCVASTSTSDLESLFEDFAYNAMRKYQRYPLAPQTARYMVFGVNDLFHQQYPFFYSRDEARDAAQELLDEMPREYGDDYVISKMESVEEEDLYDIDDIEWEMEHGDEEAITSNKEDDGDDDSDEILYENIPNDIPEEVLANPILLLEWMENRDEAPSGKRRSDADDSKTPGKQAEKRATSDKAPDKHTLDWKHSLGGKPPSSGMYILHKKKGYGKVIETGSSRFLVDFNGLKHWLNFPFCFECGAVDLVENIPEGHANTIEASGQMKLDIEVGENFDEEDDNQMADPVPFIVSKGYSCIDNRSKGGALWVIGGKSFSDLVPNLNRRGFEFTFKLGGSKATKHQDAWWCK